MIQPTTAEDLQQLWEEADRQERMLEEELAEIRADQAAYERIIARNPVKDNEVGPAKLHHAHIRPRLLAHCATHLEAFRAIAERSGGIVRINEASRLVHAAGLSKGKASSINSSMSTRLASIDEWEYVNPGTYRLLTYEGNGGDDEIGEQGGEQWLAESYPTGDGDASPRTCPANEATVVALGRITAGRLRESCA